LRKASTLLENLIKQADKKSSKVVSDFFTGSKRQYSQSKR
jgi:hypothetical protein